MSFNLPPLSSVMGQQQRPTTHLMMCIDVPDGNLRAAHRVLNVWLASPGDPEAGHLRIAMPITPYTQDNRFYADAAKLGLFPYPNVLPVTEHSEDNVGTIRNRVLAEAGELMYHSLRSALAASCEPPKPALLRAPAIPDQATSIAHELWLQAVERADSAQATYSHVRNQSGERVRLRQQQREQPEQQISHPPFTQNIADPTTYTGIIVIVGLYGMRDAEERRIARLFNLCRAAGLHCFCFHNRTNQSSKTVFFDTQYYRPIAKKDEDARDDDIEEAAEDNDADDYDADGYDADGYEVDDDAEDMKWKTTMRRTTMCRRCSKCGLTRMCTGVCNCLTEGG